MDTPCNGPFGTHGMVMGISRVFVLGATAASSLVEYAVKGSQFLRADQIRGIAGDPHCKFVIIGSLTVLSSPPVCRFKNR